MVRFVLVWSYGFMTGLMFYWILAFVLSGEELGVATIGFEIGNRICDLFAEEHILLASLMFSSFFYHCVSNLFANTEWWSGLQALFCTRSSTRDELSWLYRYPYLANFRPFAFVTRRLNLNASCYIGGLSVLLCQCSIMPLAYAVSYVTLAKAMTWHSNPLSCLLRIAFLGMTFVLLMSIIFVLGDMLQHSRHGCLRQRIDLWCCALCSWIVSRWHHHSRNKILKCRSYIKGVPLAGWSHHPTTKSSYNHNRTRLPSLQSLVSHTQPTKATRLYPIPPFSMSSWYTWAITLRIHLADSILILSREHRCHARLPQQASVPSCLRSGQRNLDCQGRSRLELQSSCTLWLHSYVWYRQDFWACLPGHPGRHCHDGLQRWMAS